MNQLKKVQLIEYPKLLEAIVMFIEDNEVVDETRTQEQVLEHIADEMSKAGYSNLTLEYTNTFLKTLSAEQFKKFCDGEAGELQTEIETVADEVLSFVMDLLIT